MFPPHDLGCRCGRRRCSRQWCGYLAQLPSISACRPVGLWNWGVRSKSDAVAELANGRSPPTTDISATTHKFGRITARRPGTTAMGALQPSSCGRIVPTQVGRRLPFSVLVRRCPRVARRMTETDRTMRSCDRGAVSRSYVIRFRPPYVREARTTEAGRRIHASIA